VILVIVPSTFSTNHYTKLNKHNQNDIESKSRLKFCFVLRLNFLVFLYKNLSSFELLQIILGAIVSPVSNWSKVTPRYVTLGFDSITFWLQATFKELNFCNLLLDGNKMDSVWPKCIDNLVSVCHSLTDPCSRLRVSSISDTSTNKAESSAYSTSLHLTAIVMSFTYIRLPDLDSECVCYVYMWNVPSCFPGEQSEQIKSLIQKMAPCSQVK